MQSLLGRRIRCGLLAACVASLAFNTQSADAGGLVIPLAQAAPTVQPPANVSAPARMYIMEGIVVAVLAGAAIFAVCRSSGRT
jgi:hypothetical protein